MLAALGASIPAAYWLADKRSVTLDLDTAEGQATARRLAARVDIARVAENDPFQLWMTKLAINQA